MQKNCQNHQKISQKIYLFSCLVISSHDDRKDIIQTNFLNFLPSPETQIKDLSSPEKSSFLSQKSFIQNHKQDENLRISHTYDKNKFITLPNLDKKPAFSRRLIVTVPLFLIKAKNQLVAKYFFVFSDGVVYCDYDRNLDCYHPEQKFSNPKFISILDVSISALPLILNPKSLGYVENLEDSGLGSSLEVSLDSEKETEFSESRPDPNPQSSSLQLPSINPQKTIISSLSDLKLNGLLLASSFKSLAFYWLNPSDTNLDQFDNFSYFFRIFSEIIEIARHRFYSSGRPVPKPVCKYFNFNENCNTCGLDFYPDFNPQAQTQTQLNSQTSNQMSKSRKSSMSSGVGNYSSSSYPKSSFRRNSSIVYLLGPKLSFMQNCEDCGYNFCKNCCKIKNKSIFCLECYKFN